MNKKQITTKILLLTKNLIISKKQNIKAEQKAYEKLRDYLGLFNIDIVDVIDILESRAKHKFNVSLSLGGYI